MKAVYKLKEHYSMLHKWLNEEGLGVQDISEVIQCNSSNTCRNYLKDPTKLKVEHIINISEELDVDYNFIIDIIKQ
tara:strand:- start:387 stop:614 length:228 start_codon:yes stop_codon:yes gene_type:complete